MQEPQQLSTDPTSNMLPMSRDSSLSLEMPNSNAVELDDFDISYHQKNFNDEIGYIQSLNLSGCSDIGNYTSAADYIPLVNQQQYYRSLATRQEGYSDTDSTMTSQFHEADYPLNDAGEYLQDRTISNPYDPPGYSNNGAARDMVESNSNMVRSRVVSGAVTPQSRHARRLYVGGLNSSHCDEESIKSFLNHVISTALGDDPDTAYILSIYVNQQKCFAFIELNSIELTTACLELDGILFQNSPLKILRANEYKPELLPPSMFSPIKLNLSGLLFAHSTTLSHGNASPSFNPVIDPQSDQLIKYCSLNAIQRGSVVIVGFPYDDIYRRALPPVSLSGKVIRGCALSPRAIRSALRKFQSGPIVNPEFGIDMSQLKVYDVGDIQAGLSPQEAFKSLADIIAQIIQRGATPFVIGGASDVVSNIAAGILMVSSNIGLVNVSASADATVLEDSRFYSSRGNFGPKQNCEGRYVQFAAQGSASTVDQARLITERGGKIFWYRKDLRARCFLQDGINQSAPQSPISASSTTHKIDICTSFRQVLSALNTQEISGTPTSNRSVCACISMSSVSSAYFPGHHQLRSSGLNADEVTDIAFALGKDKNVTVVCINDFNAEIEELRSGRLIVDIMYNFFLGFSIRATNFPTSRLTVTSSAMSSKVSTPRTNVLPGSRSSTPQNVPGSKLGNPNLPVLSVVSPAAQSGLSGIASGLPPYPSEGIYNPNSARSTPSGVSPFYSQSPSNFESTYGSPYNAGSLNIVGNSQSMMNGPPFNAGYDSYPFPGQPGSRPGSKGDSPSSYSSGYTTNGRSSSRNDSPSLHPVNLNPPLLPPYY